jgi:hypothetical protein
VNGASTSKVERREVVQPTVGVPGPASNRAVDNGCPAESKDHGWQDASTLEAATDDEYNRANAEEHLIETEDYLRKKGGAGRRGRHDILQAKVCHIANEGISGSRVCEGISPEHPLKAYTGLCQSWIKASML